MKLSEKIYQEDLSRIASAELPWSTFADKTVLITGANGFIPTYLVDTLVSLNRVQPELNIRILALVRNEAKALARFGKECIETEIELIVQDVCDPINIPGKIHYILHAASQAAPNYYGVDPVGTLKANVIGTYNLLETARRADTKGFLFVSSGEVYGAVEKKPTAEHDYGYVDPLEVRSCYAESKRMAENMCISWCHQYNIPVKIVRPFHTYGPGLDLKDVRSQAEFVANVVNKEDISLSSDGSPVRCFCYITDAIEAFFYVILKGENAHAYNVSNNHGEISIRGLAELVVSLFPERGLKVLGPTKQRTSGYIQSPVQRTSPDINKLRTLGWKPQISIEKGFKRTIEAYL